MESLNLKAFSQLVMLTQPYASAMLHGNDTYPDIGGTVRFYKAAQGTLVVAEVFNLPPQMAGQDGMTSEFYAFHIHEGEKCGSGALPDAFKATGGHYNPEHKEHPMHAGDLPPLLGNNGYAYLAAYTGRFTPEQVVGRTAVVHAHPDDFKTQPSGDAGQKLACGEIKAG